MDEKRFSEIIEEYQQPILSVIQKMVVSWDNARDLCQDTFLKIWDYRHKINDEKPIFTLLYKIAINISIDYLRKKRPETSRLDIEIPISEIEGIGFHEVYQLILDCSKRLQPKQKAVFILRDIEGFSFEEIKMIMNMPVSNIQSNLHLARKNIKNYMESIYQINQEIIYEV